MKWPLKIPPKIPPEGHVGDFGFRRSFYHHPGIDIYCKDNQEVFAIEDGLVVNIEQFTGINANPSSPWWNDTFSILIEGQSGVIGYCELKLYDKIIVGSCIKEGDLIGFILPVLKKDKGNGTSMLHIEQYISGTTEHVTWFLDVPQPSQLVNPRNLLYNIINEDKINI